LQLPLFFDLLQAPPQKIDLQRLAADFSLQLSDPAFLLAPLAVAGECLEAVIPLLTPPAVQNIGVHLAGPRDLGDPGAQV
jgi:hypothetical protein